MQACSDELANLNMRSNIDIQPDIGLAVWIIPKIGDFEGNPHDNRVQAPLLCLSPPKSPSLQKQLAAEGGGGMWVEEVHQGGGAQFEPSCLLTHMQMLLLAGADAHVWAWMWVSVWEQVCVSVCRWVCACTCPLACACRCMCARA